jgi:hypothetical protein
MTMRVRGFALTGAAVLLMASAAADDSTASLSAGGIIFTKTTPVRMADEDLYISPKLVRIRFSFANDTGKDVETLVAFPLPDIDTNEFSETGIGVIGADAVNFVGFTAEVNGKKVPLQTEQRAFYDGRDVTALLNTMGAPLNPVVGDNFKILDALKGKSRQGLLDAGLAGDEGEGHLHPHWTVKTRFYWKQVFPAHKTIVIRHSYQPVTGWFLFTDSEFEKPAGDTVPATETFCMDAGTQKIARTKLKVRKEQQGSSGVLAAYVTDYILSTANNWNGPIGRFHLTLDKMKPNNLMSLCWDNRLIKPSPTRFETTLKDFVPARDIHLLVLE